MAGDVFGICPLLSIVRLKASAPRAVDKAACDRLPGSQHDGCVPGEQRLEQGRLLFRPGEPGWPALRCAGRGVGLPEESGLRGCCFLFP